jgi:hypothetical protein
VLAASRQSHGYRLQIESLSLAANERFGIRDGVCVGPREWPAQATCVHDLARAQGSSDKHPNNSVAGSEWSSAAPRNNLAGHSMGQMKDLLLCDHARGRKRVAPQLSIWFVAGVRVQRPHAWLARARRYDDAADAWPLATVAVHADTRDPDSSADSIASADRCDRNPSVSICAAGAVALWYGRDRLK